MLLADGISWPCGTPSPNGEVTRVVMLSYESETGLKIAARLELPGEGSVGVCRNGESEPSQLS
jgi:hypothetical protein